jgi:NADPH:quinone reductase-like Zn-dependent oxidoreductase
MRAFAIDQFGTPGSVLELPTPAVEPGAVQVRVTVAGVNPLDWKVRDGMMGRRPLPFVLGQDFAGVVERAGEAVTAFAPGDRIFGIARTHGSYAQYTLVTLGVHAEPVAKIPEGLTDSLAAALPTAGLTALAGLAILDVKQGTKLLVVGAAGAVGGYAVQLARARGAHVIATARSGKEEMVRRLGAAEVIAYDRRDVSTAVKAGHPEGVDAVLDVASDRDAIKTLAAAIRAGGKIASTIGAIEVEWFAQRKIEATNVSVSQAPQSSPEGLSELAAMAVGGTLTVRIEAERALDDAALVLENSKAGRITGKVVLKIE